MTRTIHFRPRSEWTDGDDLGRPIKVIGRYLYPDSKGLNPDQLAVYGHNLYERQKEVFQLASKAISDAGLDPGSGEVMLPVSPPGEIWFRPSFSLRPEEKPTPAGENPMPDYMQKAMVDFTLARIRLHDCIGFAEQDADTLIWAEVLRMVLKGAGDE